MKKINLFIISFLITGIVSAQDSFIGMAMGGSIPVGNYAATTEANQTGYALSGFSLNFIGDYYFMKILGIGATATFGMNGTDEFELEKDWIDYLENLHDITIPPDANVRFISSQWTYVNLFIGPIISIPIKRISIELKAQGGVSFITPPKRDIYITYEDTEINSNSSGSNIAFGYLLGAGIQFRPNEAYGLRIGADYFASEAKLNLEHRVDEGPEEGKIVTDIWEIPVQAYHVTIGISYFF
ncbi:MAG: outer membrane beta-barrel protein [Bacteroidales bacterium]|nr:outer membrane beta-barrel protein [Bacteroidales bacterium]